MTIKVLHLSSIPVLLVKDALIKCQHVIPAQAGIQVRTTGFRVKPGMTESDGFF